MKCRCLEFLRCSPENWHRSWKSPLLKQNNIFQTSSLRFQLEYRGGVLLVVTIVLVSMVIQQHPPFREDTFVQNFHKLADWKWRRNQRAVGTFPHIWWFQIAHFTACLSKWADLTCAYFWKQRVMRLWVTRSIVFCGGPNFWVGLSWFIQTNSPGTMRFYLHLCTVQLIILHRSFWGGLYTHYFG